MLEYEVKIKKYNGVEKDITVIAEKITSALDLVDLYIDKTYGNIDEWTIVDCHFTKKINTCLIQKFN